jgi:hypothetical protein
MTQINIPSINIDTPIPYTLRLRDKGQPLEGLYIPRGSWSQLAYVMITERHSRWHGGVGEVIGYNVTTVGLSPQTKRETEFNVRGRAEMVKFVNAWIAKTVAAGLKKATENQAEQNEIERQRNERIAKQIETAGGVEARRQEIVREGYNLAAQDAMQYEPTEVYGAIITALIHSTPIVLDEKIRDRILAKYESSKTDWGVKRYIDDQTRELDDYLGKTQTGEAA